MHPFFATQNREKLDISAKTPPQKPWDNEKMSKSFFNVLYSDMFFIIITIENGSLEH